MPGAEARASGAEARVVKLQIILFTLNPTESQIVQAIYGSFRLLRHGRGLGAVRFQPAGERGVDLHDGSGTQERFRRQSLLLHRAQGRRDQRWRAEGASGGSRGGRR